MRTIRGKKKKEKEEPTTKTTLKRQTLMQQISGKGI